MLRFLFPLRFRQWLGPFIVAGSAAALIGLGIILSGWIDITATTPHPAGWAELLHFVFRRSTAHHARDIVPPADLDSAVRVVAGATYYGQACVHCHGAPGFGQNQVALSMTPRPQYLPHEATRFAPRDLFWIVRHGVKYSAMPGWPADGRDDEVWNLVAYLRAQPRLSPEAFRELALNPPAGEAPAHPFGPVPPQRAYQMRGAELPLRATYNYAVPTIGFDEFALSDQPARTCARCHGADGGGGGAFPNIAIQDRTYIADSLRAFAAGVRRSGYMQPVAAQLSPAQIDALAAYYNGQPRRRADAAPSPAAPIGRQLALVGDKVRGLGPCAGCHGVTRAAGKAIPRLEGQSAWYTANQMRVFRTPEGRGGEALNPMPAIARKLREPEIAAVAAFYAGEAPAVVQAGTGAPR